MGINVIPLSYPRPSSTRIKKACDYAIGFMSLFRRFLACENRSILHITGLYKYFICLEWLMVRLAKMKQCRVVYDIRAGAMMHYFERYSTVYRHVFSSTLRGADTVMIEGEEYSEFVRSLTGRAPLYLPNHFDPSDLVLPIDTRDRDFEPSIVYVGRIVPEKGIAVVLQASRALTRMSIAHRLRLVGEGNDRYLTTLRNTYKDCEVDWCGSLSSAEVVTVLRKSHFFLFPTWYFGEGHSNALTEAMATGCVPVASEAGFNRSVIGSMGRVLRLSATGQDYADAIAEIWGSGIWRELSQGAASRARERFSTPQVVATLLEEYQRLRSLA